MSLTVLPSARLGLFSYVLRSGRKKERHRKGEGKRSETTQAAGLAASALALGQKSMACSESRPVGCLLVFAHVFGDRVVFKRSIDHLALASN